MFELLKTVFQQIIRHECPALAGQIAFSFMLSLVPGIVFLTAIVTFLGENPQEWMLLLVKYLDDFVPPDFTIMIKQILTGITKSSSVGLITATIFLALWTSSSGMASIIRGLDKAYQVKTKRNFFSLRFLAVFLVVSAGMLIVTSFNLILVSVEMMDGLSTLTGGNNFFLIFYKIIRWPIAVLFIFSAVSFLYYFGPKVKHHLTDIIPGAIFFSVSWFMVTWGLSYYIKQPLSISFTFGILGSSVLLMMWMYVTAFVLLLGGELNAAIFSQSSRNS